MLNLCKREQKILKFIKDGWAFNEIAKKMQLSPRTIGFLVAEIKCKVENAGGSLAELIEKNERS